MNRFKFIHAADIHLDSPLLGLSRYDTAPVDAIRQASRRAMEKLVGDAIDLEVAFVLIGGDLYDGDWRDYGTGLFLTQQMARLRDASIPVYLVTGNHDAQNQMTKRLRPPDNVTILDSSKPETKLLPELDVAIHGQSFATREVKEDLAAGFPVVTDHSLLHIGVLHTSLDGREGHAPYAPTTPGVLAGKGYDYWALGHVHRREVVSQNPWIVFPGNIQGRHARETGPKGYSLVTVDDCRIVDVEERRADVMMWEHCEVSVADAQDPDHVLARTAQALRVAADRADGRALAVRVTLTGPTLCHNDLVGRREHWAEEVRNLASTHSAQEVWIEKVRIETREPGETVGGSADEVISRILAGIRISETGGEDADCLRSALADLNVKLPSELRFGEDAIDFETEHGLSNLAAEARELLAARIATLGAAE